MAREYASIDTRSRILQVIDQVVNTPAKAIA
jgi:hypothetical protein